MLGKSASETRPASSHRRTHSQPWFYSPDAHLEAELRTQLAHHAVMRREQVTSEWSINLHAQGDGNVAQQIKQLQQESRNVQMTNDASSAQQHLADGFMAGNSWGE